ncbi:SpoIIE family protein phosphatase, partial [Streptomyces sp. NPDC047970]|uniref:SpoIIE family protein phosphatase n=1 Tax=Streptomyces sp. NPDC047970 TaxID=3155481 RepID=UPI0034432E47
ATCIYAVYDPHRAQVCLANAGHLPPVLVRRGYDGTLRVLVPGAAPSRPFLCGVAALLAGIVLATLLLERYAL